MNDLAIYTDLSPLDRTNLAPGTLRHYKAAITLLIASNIDPTDYTQLADYANTLPHSGKANLKAALRIMTQDYINKAKTSSASIETIQRFLWMVEAMNDAIQIHAPKTERTPHWLSQAQVNTITAAALSNSMRDYIILAVLLGAGLRREELETLTFDSLSQIPYKNKMKDVLSVKGKGDKKRIIPIDAGLAQRLREWKSKTKGGRIARRMLKGGKIGKSLNASRIFLLVRQYGHIVGIEDLAPHDLRRTYGRLMYEATNDIVLVQNLLGHSDTKTTLRYIGYDLNLDIDFSPVAGVQVSGD
jgi:site-specific recombinase XerC